MGNLGEANAAILEDLQSSAAAAWSRAERVTKEIISQVQPTIVSEEKRREVIDYVQRIIRDTIGCEVFSFGSVPLRTYLPDGDIDLTAFCDFNCEEALALNVYSVLEAEDRNPAAECVVKDVQYILAEVKLVKCLIQDIIVDISFNQIGGLCTLCFLEQADLRIGTDHLFKRSIILIKAWCYYESRILGAHHGLISTYALEMLVLYIFHRFHSSLNGPLEVLYKFLDYYRKFDWENFCVSLNGPIHISSLPELVAETTGSGSGDALFSRDFFKESVEIFSVPPRGNEATKTFTRKHLNIVDPLKVNNNLGRSVSKGNFYRIRSAISLGARKLGRILLQPEENIEEEAMKFFANTLYRHGRGQSPDVKEAITGASCPDDVLHDLQNTFLELDSGCISSSNPPNGSVELSTYVAGVYRSSAFVHVESELPFRSAPRAPHLHFPAPSGNGKVGNGELDAEAPPNSCSQNGFCPLQSSSENIGFKNEPEHDETLSDLSGDYESHLNNWQFGRWWFNHAAGMPVNGSIRPPSMFLKKNSWEKIHRRMHTEKNFWIDSQPNGMIPRPPPFYPMNPPMVPGGAGFRRELMKAQGTGMYFPITNHQRNKERSSPVKPAKYNRYNGHGFRSLDNIACIDRSCDELQIQSSVQQSKGKLLSSDFQDASSLRESEKQAGLPVFLVSGDRFASETYHLKDEEDFPPLST
ncbi:hypothetical protein AKJ16_DCAP15147 [Drosera capensis]